MKHTRNLLLLFSTLMLPAVLFAQDTHFSQYATTPMAVNPALTGIFDGTLRWSNNYRSQWGGLDKAYATIYSSLDFPLGKEKTKNHYFGAGIMVNSDKASGTGFFTTQFQGSLSFTAAIDELSTHFFALGLQAGLNQRGADLTKFTWDNQWNGNNYDPSLGSGETIQLSEFTFADFSAGMLWYTLPDSYNSGYAGISFSHLNRPNTSFYVKQTDKLPVRFTVHAGADLAIDRNENATWIAPRLLAMKQGSLYEITVGGMVRHRVILKSKYTNYRKEVLFSWGAAYRWNDAVVGSVRADYGRFGLGVSYDLTVSGLSTAAGGTGSPEVSLSYMLPVRRGNAGSLTGKLPRFF
jgi:type IX secretion system PorP/SprF family membrane protein